MPPSAIDIPWGPDASAPTRTLTCERAIDAVLAALPIDHLRVLRIGFSFGFYCPPGHFCALNLAINDGYVVLIFEDKTALWAPVRAGRSGKVSLRAALAPFPGSG